MGIHGHHLSADLMDKCYWSESLRCDFYILHESYIMHMDGKAAHSGRLGNEDTLFKNMGESTISKAL